MKSAALSSAVVIFLLVMGTNCQKQGQKWKGIIEERDGVVYVTNPQHPTNENAGLGFEEELSIGREDGKAENVFSRVGGIDVDETGNIYVLDLMDANVRVFDSRGKYLRTIGRKGQGPGEVQFPVFMQITSRSEVLIYDYAVSRMLFFSLDGRFLSDKTTLQPILPIRVDSRGNLIGKKILAPPPKGGKVIYKYNPAERSFMEIAKEDMGAGGMLDIGRPSCYCAVTQKDMIIWGSSEKYAFYVLNQHGKTVKKVTRQYEPQSITVDDEQAYKTQYAELLKANIKITFRSNFPAFSDIFVDDEDHIFIKTYERDAERGGAFFFDVYDGDGVFIAKVPVEISLNKDSVWKKGKLYTITSDENGVQVIKRYGVTWTGAKGMS
jgi:DNA-binding beta-propeller fold protein YncE